MRATSGAEALEALRELKLRGDRVAVLLADYRMPEMSGIEFLEQAMDLFPRARRALLTAYADTDAAIAAINVVDVDHYLLKPWEPPEEKLYPVVDAMLESYLAGADVEVRETKVIGHRWSAPSFEVRDFLARNAVPYRWFAADEPEGGRLLGGRRRRRRRGCRSSSRRTARRWSRRRPPRSPPRSACRRRRRPTSTTWSSSAAARPGWARRSTARPRGCGPCWSSGRRPAGRPGSRSRIENYLGFPDGVSGAQLTDRARRQATKFGAEILTARDVTGLRTNGPARVVSFGDGTEVAAHAVIVATGVSYRDLDGAGRRGAHRPRRLLRLGRDRGRGLRRHGRLHRRRRQLRRPGRGVLLPGGQVGDPGGARDPTWRAACRTT